MENEEFEAHLRQDKSVVWLYTAMNKTIYVRYKDKYDPFPSAKKPYSAWINGGGLGQFAKLTGAKLHALAYLKIRIEEQHEKALDTLVESRSWLSHFTEIQRKEVYENKQRKTR